MEPDFDQPTRWSVVWRAGHGNTREMRLAREELARIYWQPVFQHIRRKGLSIERAEDLTQGFFEYLIEKNLFATAQSDRGKLRGFFFDVLGKFLVSEWRRERGHSTETPLDDRAHALESPDRSPDREFDRAWALATIHRALEATQSAYVANGRGQAFEELRPYLTPGSSRDEGGYESLAEATGQTNGSLRTAVTRLRKDFGHHLASLVARTLDRPTPEAVRREIGDLLECLEGQ